MTSRRLHIGRWSLSATALTVVAIVALIGGGVVYARLGGGSGSNLGAIDLQRGLVSWWKLDANGKDSTPYANDSTINGASVSSDRKGASGRAYSFDGSNDYMAASSATPATVGSFTVSVWVKGVSGPSAVDGYSYIVHRSAGTGIGGSVYWIGINANGEYAATVNGGSTNNYGSTGITATSADWHLITLVYDGTNQYVYADGSLRYSRVAGSITSTTTGNTLSIGGTALNPTYRPFNGTIDDVRVYNRPLQSGEVQTLYGTYDGGVRAASGEKGLVGWWKLNGNTKDATPYGVNASVVNGATTTADRKGLASGAYSFNGTNQYISIPVNPALVVGQPSLTVSAWINPATLSGTMAVVSRNGPYLLWIDGVNKRLYTGLLVGSTWYWAYSANNSLMTNQWQHVAMTFDGTSRKLYVNGVQSGPTDVQVSGNISTTSPITNIGNDPATGGRFYFNGSIGDVRIYNRALSAQELNNQANSYNSQLNLNSSPSSSSSGTVGNINAGLVGYWPFNGNAKDATPYSNSGTVNGAVLGPDRRNRANGAYQFGTTNQWINVGSPASYNALSNGFTMSVWLSYNGTASSYQWPVVMGASNTHVNYGIRSSLYGARIYFEYGIAPFAGADWGGCGGYTTAANVWHMYTYTYDGSTLRTYLDGAYTAQCNISGGLSPTFGGFSFSTSTNGWNGSMDDARLYNRPLSATEVSALYAAY